MKIATVLVSVLNKFIAAYVFMYGFNNLLADLINFRCISYFESWIFVAFAMAIGWMFLRYSTVKETTDEEDLKHVIAKALGYGLSWLWFFILVLLK